jgi:hypothetical protein
MRFEWDGVQPITMAGGTPGHSLLASRLAAAIEAAADRRACTLLRPDVKVRTERGNRVRYPDLVVTVAAERAEGGGEAIPVGASAAPRTGSLAPASPALS